MIQIREKRKDNPNIYVKRSIRLCGVHLNKGNIIVWDKGRSTFSAIIGNTLEKGFVFYALKLNNNDVRPLYKNEELQHLRFNSKHG